MSEAPAPKMTLRVTWSSHVELERLVIQALWEIGGTQGFPTDDTAIPTVFLTLPKFQKTSKGRSAASTLELLLMQAIELQDGALDLEGEGPYPDHRLRQTARAFFGLIPKPELRDPYDIETMLEWLTGGDLGALPEIRARIKHQIVRPIASWLCAGAPSYSLPLPSLDELENALARIIRRGLPLRPDQVTPDLLAFLPLSTHAESEHERVVLLGSFIEQQLDNFEVDELAHAAKVLFAHTSGTKGTEVQHRDEKVMEALGLHSIAHARDRNRPSGGRKRILFALAWQIYRARILETAD